MSNACNARHADNTTDNIVGISFEIRRQRQHITSIYTELMRVYSSFRKLSFLFDFFLKGKSYCNLPNLPKLMKKTKESYCKHKESYCKYKVTYKFKYYCRRGADMYIYTEEYKRFRIEEITNKKCMTEAEFRFLRNMNKIYPELFQDFIFVKRKELKQACGV